MKSLLVASALASSLCLSPAMADDEASTSFHALRALSTDGPGTVAAMTEQELAAVQGEGWKCEGWKWRKFFENFQNFSCVGACFNLAIVTQVGGTNILQINQALGNFNRSEQENEID